MKRLAITGDFFDEAGVSKFPQFDVGALREHPRIEAELIDVGDEIESGALAGFDVLLVLRPKVTRASLAGADRLKLVVRFGAGYDRVDAAACRDAGIAIAIARTAVGRPVAVAELTLMLALINNMLAKDAIVRRGPGAWGERPALHGKGLLGLVVGSIGFGTIMREFVSITRPMGLNYLIHDPYVDAASEADDVVSFAGLDSVLSRSDVLLVNCPLTDGTHGLIGAPQIARMKRGAIVINTARGGIVDEQALAEALGTGQIGGAGIDVFEHEPVALGHPLLSAPNTIVTPHSLAWTDQLFDAIGKETIENVLAFVEGRSPPGLVA